MRKLIFSFLLLITQLISGYASANEVEVVKVSYSRQSAEAYTFHVTLLHGDTGWDHYADAWSVLDMNKKVIATRVLYHPHESEQPFTRSLSGINIPAGTKSVYVRGHDKVHGDGALFKVELK